VTDAYGPAPAGCFNPSTVPSGVTLNGPALGYLPFSNSQFNTSCNVIVPATQTSYDQGITGLAETYYPDGEEQGAAGLYGMGNGSDTSTATSDTCTGSPVVTATTTADLCAAWPAGNTPQYDGVTLGTDSNDQWSLQMAGTIDLASAGSWIFCVEDNQAFTMDIDGSLVLTNIEYELDGSEGINNDFQGTYAGIASVNCENATLAAGYHTISIMLDGTPAQATSYELLYMPPTEDTTIYPVTLSMLDPAYGLKTAVTDPDGDITTYSYSDPAGGITPMYGLVTSTTQDTATTQDPDSPALTTSATYQDPADSGTYLLKTASTLPAGNSTGYEYYSGTASPLSNTCGVTAGTDQLGLLKQLTGPAPGGSGQSRVEQFVYDANGTQAGVRVGTPGDIGSQPWQCTTYYPGGQIASQSWPATSTAPARTVTYSYSVGGNPLVSSVSDASGTITDTVDLLGRMVSYTDVWGQTRNVTYSQAGQVTSTTFDPGGADTTTLLGYYPDGQPESTTVNGTLLATASYNASTGQLASVGYANGTTATLGYDTYDRQDSITYTSTSSGATLAADGVTYSLAGRETAETASQGSGTVSIGYGYDGAGRLTSADDTINGTVTDNAYSYADNPASDNCSDPGAGANTNLTSVTTTTGSTTQATDYCYNTADQLVSSTTYSQGSVTGTSTAYAYSQDGDQTNDNGTTYTWDASDRAATATTPGGTTITSTYDPVDRLIQSAQSGGSTVRYSYAGYTSNPAAILNTSNGILQQIIPLPGGATAILQSSGTTWSYTNMQGDTVITASNTGTLTSGPVTYNPWGVLNPGQTAPATTTGPSTFGAYTTSGKLTDTTTGTILLGARTFNPVEARFLSVDPLQGGCANPYTYAFGDPLGHPDLTGQGCGSHSSWWEYLLAGIGIGLGIVALATGVGALFEAVAVAAATTAEAAAAAASAELAYAAFAAGTGLAATALDARDCHDDGGPACYAVALGGIGLALSGVGVYGAIEDELEFDAGEGEFEIKVDLSGKTDYLIGSGALAYSVGGTVLGIDIDSIGLQSCP
jgi:RHS repeat-associated protein